MRYFVAFSYFGKSYHGWQKQPNALTVQQVLEETFSTLLRQPVELMGAGRTDAGVHARQMYAHFEVDEIVDKEELCYRMNSFLPDDIAISGIYEVPDNAHARFDAEERTYEYWIVQEKNPFHMDTAHYIKFGLDLETMNEAASLLLKHTDFECFSKSNTDVKTFLCKLKKAEWTIQGDVLVFTITADRFLRNMVRAIVGTLLEVGLGKCTLAGVEEIINSKDRSKAGVSVPAKGLYLTKVSYPSHIKLKL
ncbi:pseudouridine synthase [Sediminicola sp. YIK13]|uniref:tRNA pseudouridine(38-40) synthase TruA n=1 Tax=Sediminicola sp. YIK13 TaxID=1453352 RepID=UPI000722606C|nr:tRNA pseudouridine(38-40) synthase TruA [Sediminicola sp. YIK13]ALM09220.1 pseudouridine synthase [Sediminicola sp. YIK13]